MAAAATDAVHAKTCRVSERKTKRARFLPAGWVYCLTCERHVYGEEPTEVEEAVYTQARMVEVGR